MSSPDLNNDIEILCIDLGSQNYYAAAVDIVGIAIPGLPAQSTSGTVRFVQKWLGEHADELVKLLKYEGHHLWPKYLKGPTEQFLSKMIRFKHIKLHIALDQIFNRRLCAKTFKYFSIDDIYKALLKFYKENYPELLNEFIKNAQNVIKELK